MPLQCLTKQEQDDLLEKSLEQERTSFPQFFASPLGEKGLVMDFQDYVATNRFCSVDVDQLLDSSSTWETFFQDSILQLKRVKMVDGIDFTSLKSTSGTKYLQVLVGALQLKSVNSVSSQINRFR